MKDATSIVERVNTCVSAAIFELRAYGEDSHEVAMTEDKLREAEFWANQIRAERNVDEVG